MSESPQLEKVGGAPAGRLPALLISVALVFVVIAFIKPWPAPTTRLEPSSQPRPTAPAVTSRPPISGVGTIDSAGYFQQCYPTTSWRLTAIQGGAMEVRTVWPAAPSFAAVVRAGPGSIRVYGSTVKGIGFCAPGDRRVTRLTRAISVSLWRRDAGGGAIVPVAGMRVIDPELALEGEVYLAPPAPLAANGAWPAGDYFFKIGQAPSGSSATWLALQVLAGPAASQAPARSLSAH